jgi:flagellar hook-basal body complex protein FliE
MKLQQILSSAPGLTKGVQQPDRTDKLGESGQSFGDVLKDSIASVNELQREAGQQVEKFVAGEATAVEKARTGFDLLMEVRNKAIDTYRELMRMQV